MQKNFPHKKWTKIKMEGWTSNIFGWIQSATVLLKELQELGELHSPP